jgi:hypothetical protein
VDPSPRPSPPIAAPGAIDASRGGEGERSRPSTRWLPIALLFASFALYSALHAPVPAVNEPHYLVKARHFWQPDWCAGDLFLQSANPHVVFYATIGWLTNVLSLEHAAIVGRAIALLLLAIGWDRLLSQMLRGRWSPLIAAWVFLLLQSCGNFAGEWLVGGVESKVISYALVMWNCGAFLAGRRVWGAALLGGAISFHPVVGAWCLICLGAALVVPDLVTRWRRSRTPIPEPGVQPGTNDWMRRLGLPFAVGVLCSLPGLIPAAQMLSHPDPATSLRADIIQVAIRLDHHLDPYIFPWSAYLYYAAMLILWLALQRRAPTNPALRRLAAFTWMAIAIAVIGWLAAAGPRPITHLPLLAWRIKLLKLYPFRIADLAVPFALAVTIAGVAVTQLSFASSRRRALFAGAFAILFAWALLMPGIDRNSSRMTSARRADWIAALRWIDASTDPSSLLWAADEDWAVKWFAERAEYVNFKDCPQDAAGIIEWYERRVKLAEWRTAAAADGRFTPEELDALHEATGINYLIASRMGPVDAAPAFENSSFRVYTLAGTTAR